MDPRFYTHFHPSIFGGLPDFNIMRLNLDASDILSIAQDGSNLASQWNDKSGQLYHVTQGVSANKATFTANAQVGKSVLAFDGNDEFAVPSGLFTLSAADNTIFAVAKRTAETASIETIFAMGQNAVGEKYGLRYSATAGAVLFQNGDDGVTVSQTGGTNTNYQILTGRRNGTTMAVSINNGAEATSTAATNTTGIDLGRIGDLFGANYLTGRIAQIIIYGRSLLATERTQVCIHLSNKWGIAI